MTLGGWWVWDTIHDPSLTAIAVAWTQGSALVSWERPTSERREALANVA